MGKHIRYASLDRTVAPPDTKRVSKDLLLDNSGLSLPYFVTTPNRQYFHHAHHNACQTHVGITRM